MIRKYEGLWEREDGLYRLDVEWMNWKDAYYVREYVRDITVTDRVIFQFRGGCTRPVSSMKRQIVGFRLIAGPVGKHGIRSNV